MIDKLEEKFYSRPNVAQVAKSLLGKVLITNIDGNVTSGIIVETEAYSQKEKGCHAYKGQTKRNAVMFGKGGVSYVSLCYGIHHMFNIVTNKAGVADAVLIRAVQPLEGGEIMLERAKATSLARITSGPGKVCKALGIDSSLNMVSLVGESIWLEDRGIKFPASKILASPRIGIDYAGEDALLPWRLAIKENPWVSKK